MKIVFMGTPEFSVSSLDILVKNGYDIAAVVTVPDKPAGRGQKLHESAMKKYALENNLRVLQPEKLKSEEFVNTLKEINADLFIVVAFRMLPEIVWAMPRLGTFNLHASLLPQYRGAAPINWAIINGEEHTGVTTFFLKHEIDTGAIVHQRIVDINEEMNAGELHDQLMNTGADLVLKTVKDIEAGNLKTVEQEILIRNHHLELSSLKHAPKIFKEDMKIKWDHSSQSIYNLIRGLSPYPSAFTEFNQLTLKIYAANLEDISDESVAVGEYISDGKTYIKFRASDGFLSLKDIQLEGKKRMKIDEFLRGYRLP